MPELKPNDVSEGVSDAIKIAMADVITAFGGFDTMLSACLITAYGLDFVRGSVLIENMQIPAKISRLKALFKLLDRRVDLETATQLKKEYESKSEVRNTIAHSICLGTVARGKHKGYVAFLPLRANFEEWDKITLYSISTADMDRVTQWARGWTVALTAYQSALRAQPESLTSLRKPRQDRSSSAGPPPGKKP